MIAKRMRENYAASHAILYSLEDAIHPLLDLIHHDSIDKHGSSYNGTLDA